MKKYLLGPLMALLLAVSGCAGMPMPTLETNEERLAAAEIVFDEMAELAIKLHPRLSVQRRQDVEEAFECLHDGLLAARLSYQLKDDVDFTNNLRALQSSMALLRPILVQIEENGDVGSFEFNCLN